MTTERTWSDQIAGCFGIVDQKFARHPTDEENAKKMIKAAKSAGASSEEVLAAIKNHLKSRRQEHINDEMEFAKTFVNKYFK